MSDDDKIRLQLHFDIVEFGKLLEQRFDGYNGETNFQSLFKLVEEIGLTLANKTSNRDPQQQQLNEATNKLDEAAKQDLNQGVEFSVSEETEEKS